MIKRLARRVPRADMRNVLASVVGLAPGLVLPFVVAFQLGSREADGLLFALSLSTVAINVVTTSLEASAVARIGPTSGGIPMYALLRVFRRSVFASVAAAALLVPVLFGFFYLREPEWLDFVAAVAAFGLTPVFAVLGSPFAGALIARGRSASPIVTQGVRGVAALVVLLGFPEAPVVAVAVAYAAGELVRTGVLAQLWSRYSSAHKPQGSLPSGSTQGLAAQFGAAAVAQGNATVNRLLLSGAPVGSITAYELAEKATFALYQFIYSSLVVRRFGVWSSIVEPKARSRRYRADVRNTTFLTLGMSVVAVGLAGLGLAFDVVPESWRLGATWALVMLPSAAASIAMISAIRMLVIARRQSLLMVVSTGSLVLNAVLAIAFFAWWGAIGIPIALAANRAATAVAYYLLTKDLDVSELDSLDGDLIDGTSQIAAT